MSRIIRPSRLRTHHLLPLALCTALLAGFAGCATTNANYGLQSGAAKRIPAFKVVVVDPLDAELCELSTGGVAERRDDWTAEAAKNLTAALAAETHWQPAATQPATGDSAVREETTDVQALLRAINLNHMLRQMPGPAQLPAKPDAPLTYNTGPLPRHVAAYGSEAVLFVFVRNSYATAGRKTLAGFAVLAAAFTGVAIVPTMGSDLACAALVDSDGTVLWFNQSRGGADPRTPEGARELAKQLLSGLPKRTA